jgi:hypothetical protein
VKATGGRNAPGAEPCAVAGCELTIAQARQIEEREAWKEPGTRNLRGGILAAFRKLIYWDSS